MTIVFCCSTPLCISFIDYFIFGLLVCLCCVSDQQDQLTVHVFLPWPHVDVALLEMYVHSFSFLC